MTSLTHNDKPIEDFTEGEIAAMEPRERTDIITEAQRFVTAGNHLTPDQCANLTRLLVYVRRRAVKDNPRATAAAREAATVTAATLDDIGYRRPTRSLHHD